MQFFTEYKVLLISYLLFIVANYIQVLFAGKK